MPTNQQTVLLKAAEVTEDTPEVCHPKQQSIKPTCRSSTVAQDVLATQSGAPTVLNRHGHSTLCSSVKGQKSKEEAAVALWFLQESKESQLGFPLSIIQGA
jgi:hypothetical protein